jgi:UDP-N-acetylglucosamine 2-epimerase (non-hydrolysing)
LKRIACVVGARPNFIKMAAILEEIRQRPLLQAILIHTGQHSSPEMSTRFFEDLRLPQPDLYLGVSGGSGTQQTARIMEQLEAAFAADRPDLVLVVGDVNSTLAAAIVAAKAGIPLAHVEAGLRSHDRSMPEELNRIMTDAISDYLFTSEEGAAAELVREGVNASRIHFAGNVMIDTLLRFRDQAARSPILTQLSLTPKAYAVATLHRPSNVDDPAQLARLLTMLDRLHQSVPVVFPVHPRTRKAMAQSGLSTQVQLTDPLGYLDFLRLTSEARLVLTDSGGIQEETTILGVPCLTLRDNTERPATITHGTNQLTGSDPEKAFAGALRVLAEPGASARRPARWDGQAARRILDVLEPALLAGDMIASVHHAPSTTSLPRAHHPAPCPTL